MGGAIVNGDYYAFADIEVGFGSGLNLTIIGMKSINYSDDEGMEYVYGTARNPIGTTAGVIKPKGEIEFLKPAWNVFLSQLQAQGTAGGWRRLKIDITVSYSAASGLPTVTDVIPGCKLKEITSDNSQSDAALTQKVMLFPSGQILWNGQPSILEPQVLFADA
jgi:hypothetical protein